MIVEAFRASGVGSKAWYLHHLKRHEGRSGYSWLKLESTNEGRTIQSEEIKLAVLALVSGGYVQTEGKPGAVQLQHKLTSFGHRYLEEHKSEFTGSTHDLGEQQPDRPSDLRGKTFAVPETPPVKSPFATGTGTPAVAPKAPDSTTAPRSKPAQTMKAKEQSAPNGSITVEDLKRFAGEILYAKHAQEVSVVDLINHITSKGVV